MAALLIGYARASTDQEDLTAQRDGLTALGASANRVYVDQALTGTKGRRRRSVLLFRGTAVRAGPGRWALIFLGCLPAGECPVVDHAPSVPNRAGVLVPQV